MRRARRVAVQVVAVHRDVERADRHGFRRCRRGAADAIRERDAAGRDAEEDEIVGPLLDSRISCEIRVSAGDVGFCITVACYVLIRRSLLRLTGRC
jgi:hypothetical protein